MNKTERGLRIGLVGVGFGAEFAPIYRDHPGVASVALSDTNAERLAETARGSASRKAIPRLRMRWPTRRLMRRTW